MSQRLKYCVCYGVVALSVLVECQQRPANLWNLHVIDRDAKKYQALNATFQFELKTNGNLLRIAPPGSSPGTLLIDYHVKDFQGRRDETIFELGEDNKLWRAAVEVKAPPPPANPG